MSSTSVRTMSSPSRPSMFSLFGSGTFTRSNGSTVARVYERLTKASRRRDPGPGYKLGNAEEAYRQGLYDMAAALREELERE